YQKQHEILEKTEQLNSLRVPIYTLTFDSLAQNFFIGIQSNDPPAYKQVFIPHSEDLKETYHLGGTSCGYSDNQGKWLSAYEPIRNRNGKTVAVLVVDTLFNEFIITALYSIYKDIIFTIFIFIVLAILLGSQLKKILLKEEKARTEIMRSNKIIEVKNTELESINKEITSSIHYASKIQCSFIPLLSEIKSGFRESFIFYKPKDIISGDFYWFKKLNQHEHILAVVDCTGHGVPGAMMSVIGNNLFNQIIAQEKITQPNLILEQLNLRLNNLLNQNSSGTQDGMALSVCLINKQTQQITFSGSYNDSYLIQKNGTVITLKADKIPVGGNTSNSTGQYNTSTVSYAQGDNLYLFTDGFADQFGGQENKKFMKKNLKNLLAETATADMNMQFNSLKSAFENWMGNHFQIDDVTLLGVKL
ncbi:MAG: PP2C family protein-serine/threonine phosphatase, partial [Bacteroidia bacterium]